MAKQGKELIKNMLNDIRVNLREEFDRNFERKAFFDKPWDTTTKFKNSKGSLMMRSGALRRSIKGEVKGDSIIFSSSLPYASIHNEGGYITVTAKMKKFFWAMYYKSAGAVTYSIKKKAMNNTQRNRRLTEEAAQWKSLALTKVGQRLEIKQRQFIGDHPQVQMIVEKALSKNLKDVEAYMNEIFKPKK